MYQCTLGLSTDDVNRPDGYTLIHYSKGCSLIWDAACVDTLAGFYIIEISVKAGNAADLAELNKIFEL